jgi:TPR repeat protein
VAAFLRQDWSVALRELLAAEEDGEIEALVWLGHLYSTDHPLHPRDASRAFVYYRRAAENGHPAAEWALASAYEHGEGTEPNQVAAIHWLQLAAEDGVSEAQERLALHYRSGVGIPQESEKAEALLLLAGQKNDGLAKYRPDTRLTAEARNALALGNLDVAMQEFTKLAVRGVASAQLNLAFMYLKGLGARRDTEAAVRWLRLASEHDSVAAYSLAVLYLRGMAVPKDALGTINLLKRAQRLQCNGCSHANDLLAAVYGRGYLGRPDYKQAADVLFSRPPIHFSAVPTSDPPDLSLILLLPRFQPVSKMEERTWLARAGGGGHLRSQMGLGQLYESGVGAGPAEDFVPKDLAQAYFWYSLAAAQGDSLANKCFERVANAIGPRDRLRARQMLERFRSRRPASK